MSSDPTKDFTGANSFAHPLSSEDRGRIDEALFKYLDMDKPDRDTLIEDIQKTGGFRQFGYGSLIGDPSSDTDQKYVGEVAGWERGAFCKEIHHRGKPKKAAVTMGALPVKSFDVKLSGMVLEISADGDEGESFADRIVHNIQKFAERETSLTPIYKYQVVDVKTRKGNIKALICAADTESSLYLGEDGKILSLKEKAVVIAMSHGVQDETNQSPRRTGMAYWRFIIHCAREANVEIEPHIEALVQKAEKYRAQMLPKMRARLEAIERAGGEGYDKPVYEYDVPVLSSCRQDFISVAEVRAEGMRMHAGAVGKLKWGTDPLSQEKRAKIIKTLGL